ncbi:MAG: hypothetical protein K9M03_00860 [Kiritimatiellales bacterium]|nr:hypothetical protein [Kiritimatiellales bacterium]
MLNKYNKTQSDDSCSREHRLVHKLREGSNHEYEQSENELSPNELEYAQRFAEGNTERGRSEKRDEVMRLFSTDSDPNAKSETKGDKKENTDKKDKEPRVKGTEKSSNLKEKEQRKKAEQKLEQNIAEHERRWGQVDLSHHKPPFIKSPELRTGIAIGATPMVASYAASLGSIPLAATSIGAAGIGAYYGKKKLFPNMPNAGPAIGAIGGIAAASSIGSVTNGIMGFMQSIGGPFGKILNFGIPSVLSGLATGALGTSIGYRLGKKIGKPKWPEAAAAAGGILGLVTPPAIAASTGITAGGIASYTATIPTLGAGISSLIPASALGLTVGAGAATLYGLGHAHGKLWNRPKAGIWKTMLTGGTIGIPSIMLGGLNKLGWKPAKKVANSIADAANKNYESAKNMLLKLKVPIATPVAKVAGNALFSPIAGLINGWNKANAPSEAQEKLGVPGKIVRAPFNLAGRIAHSPIDIVNWALEETPEHWPLSGQN